MLLNRLSYAKFLKDLGTTKRRMDVLNKAFLTEQVSSIILNQYPVKYKDPGYPTISCRIGDHLINKALLDLGASVNILPYSVYLQMGLGELKPTKMRIQLADRSVIVPRGIIEDVLVKIEHFYYPVDLVVIDTEPVQDMSHQTRMILMRPFLATSNALINCRNGLMKISFGHLTLELNVFHVNNRQEDEENEEDEDSEVDEVG